MNLRGLLTAWNDSKGFGFISPEGGGALMAQQIFRLKTRKGSYQFVFWLAVLVDLSVLGWLLVALGAVSWRQQLGFDLSQSLRPFIW